MGWFEKIDCRTNKKAVFGKTIPLHLLGIKNVLKKGVQYRVKLNDGMQVVVIPEEKMKREPDFDTGPFLYVDEWAPFPPKDAPEDLAHQHDYYLYGKEKR